MAKLVLFIYGQYETSLWSQIPRRQVGADPSAAIMGFHSSVTYFLENPPEFLQILWSYDQMQKTLQNVVCFSAIISSMLRVKTSNGASNVSSAWMRICTIHGVYVCCHLYIYIHLLSSRHPVAQIDKTASLR